MAKRKKSSDTTAQPKMQGYIAGAGEVVEEKIAFTLQENFMPYAMSIIMSRAIPEIDGFKPSHRKLLYTMYKMGLLGATRTKSANIVGQTMKLNPHGDAAIYDTMVRLSRGYEALLHPFVDSKGNFGKYYSRDMAWAASRYTEAKLDPICSELFNDIDKDTVDFVDNYDNTLKEPALLPAAFPSVLVNANTGIAVGMASSICSFNLEEVCRTTIGLLKDPDFDIMSTLIAPDFTGGAQIIYDRQAIENVYSTGRGSIRLRARYTYDKYANCIDILSIPQTTTVEAVIEKVIDLVKQSKIREIADIRDETGIDGLKITIDLKRGTNPDKLMQKLYKITSLEDTFSCNFNVLIAGTPKVLGVRELLNEWSAFRIECVKRRTYYDLHKKQDRLHLLRGLEKILLDIDKAIRIIRGTEEESMVVPNLMEGFGIDELQAEYVAEIKLRHLNREYILRHTNDISQLEKDIAELESVLGSSKKIKAIIIKELENIIKKYAQPRRSMIIYADDIVEDEVEEDVPDYPVNLFFTKEGYFKKITPLSLRMGGEQKLKEGDEVIEHIETTNNSEIIFFSDRQQAYKVKTPQFADTKASVLGDYIPSKLGFDEGENAVYMISTKDYKGFVFFFFENGKAAKVSMDAYATKTNRKKLTGAYSDKDKLAAVIYAPDDDTEILLKSSSGRRLLFKASDLSTKTSRAAQGVALMKLTKGHRLISAKIYTDGMLSDPSRYRAKNLPAMGQFTGADEAGEQITF